VQASSVQQCFAPLHDVGGEGGAGSVVTKFCGAMRASMTANAKNTGTISPVLGDVVPKHPETLEPVDANAGVPWMLCAKRYALRHGHTAWPLVGMPAFLHVKN
jgi:hypothetical protein